MSRASTTRHIASLSFLAVFLMLIAPATAIVGQVNITGTNSSTAQANVTIINAPSQVQVTSWAIAGNVKSFISAVTGTSTPITWILANFTAGMIENIMFNGTSVQGVQVNSSGYVVFTYNQTPYNGTFTLQAAQNSGGVNYTWAYFQSIAYKTINITSDYNITVPFAVAAIMANAATGQINIGLPNASEVQGYQIIIKKKDSSVNAVSVSPSSGTIDGSRYANITVQYNSITLVSDGTEWNII